MVWSEDLRGSSSEDGGRGLRLRGPNGTDVGRSGFREDELTMVVLYPSLYTVDRID